MNKFACTGRIVNDPELKITPNQISVLSFTVAVKRPRTKEVADFLPCVAWRQNAEFLSKFAHKGDMVGISVEERLPEKNYHDFVLAWNGLHVEFLHYDHRYKQWEDYCSLKEHPWKVTHWMPLPEPPKGE